MNGHASNESKKLGKRSEWLERGVWFAGGLVVAGLLMEYGPEIGIALARHEAPKPVTVGGLLVILGVAAEVLLGIFVAKTAKRLQMIAESENLHLRADLQRAIAESRSKQTELEVEQRKTAEAQEKAAKAQEALTQNLSSFAKRSGDRVLDFQKFVDGLKTCPVFTVRIWYTPNSDEAERFSDDIERALQYAHWPVSRRSFTLADSLSGIHASEIRGIMFFFHDEEDMGRTDPFHGFMWSLLRALRFGGASEAATTAPELPKGTVAVVIGPKVKL